MKFDKILLKLKRIKQIPRKFFEKITKLFDEDDKKAIISFLSSICFYGLVINYSLFVIFKYPFSWYSWPAYGFIVFLIENKLIKWLRSLWFR